MNNATSSGILTSTEQGTLIFQILPQDSTCNTHREAEEVEDSIVP